MAHSNPSDGTPSIMTDPGPPASRARAVEIAAMGEFGLQEFIELTGVGAGDFGIYRVTAARVSIRLAETVNDADLGNWTMEEQLVFLRARRCEKLDFPCTPAAFTRWYESTRGHGTKGELGVSDFSLAPGFAREVRRREGASPDSPRVSVTSRAIMAAFIVEADARANEKWWNQRLRDPRKYGKGQLVGARAMRGGPREPSRWYPDVVASWLIECQRLSKVTALRAMEAHFPDVDIELLR